MYVKMYTKTIFKELLRRFLDSIIPLGIFSTLERFVWLGLQLFWLLFFFLFSRLLSALILSKG